MQNIGQAQNTYPGRVQADTAAVLVLVANTEQHFNTPTGASVAVFASTANFYILVNGQTAAVPVATNVAFPVPNTIPDLNPSVLSVTPGVLISAVSPSSCVLIINFYQDTDLLGPF